MQPRLRHQLGVESTYQDRALPADTGSCVAPASHRRQHLDLGPAAPPLAPGRRRRALALRARQRRGQLRTNLSGGRTRCVARRCRWPRSSSGPAGRPGSRTPAGSCPRKCPAPASPGLAVRATAAVTRSFREGATSSSTPPRGRRRRRRRSSSAGCLTSKASAPRSFKSSMCSRKSPWSAMTPTRARRSPVGPWATTWGHLSINLSLPTSRARTAGSPPQSTLRPAWLPRGPGSPWRPFRNRQNG